MTPEQVAKRLDELGWMPELHSPSQGLLGASEEQKGTARKGIAKRALAEYKAFHGLPPDTSLDDVARHMQLPRCGRPDVEPGGLHGLFGVAGLSSWAKGLRVRVQGLNSIGYLTAEQTYKAIQDALASWEAVCGILFNLNPTDGAFNITMAVGQIDGPYGTLAYSYMPPANAGPTVSLGQTYDRGESWTQTFLQAVVAHEVGHAIGLPHAPGSSSLMSPYITKIVVPQAIFDIPESQRRYGPRVVTPPPPPEIPPVDLAGFLAGLRKVQKMLADATVANSALIEAVNRQIEQSSYEPRAQWPV